MDPVLLSQKIETHPCFNPRAQLKFGRIHLPVAPKCNIQCNYCSRSFDCANETRPGVSSSILTPELAVERVRRVLQDNPSITVAGIAGPGDPFATPEVTFRTLSLIRNQFPSLKLCLSTNGLVLADYLNEINELGVEFITLTINAITPSVAMNLYSWVKYQGRIYRGIEAGEILIQNQRYALSKLADSSVIVKVNSVLIPGLNDSQIPSIAENVSKFNVHLFNIIPLIPVRGTLFAGLLPPSSQELALARRTSEKYIKLMKHCRQCRADAIGLLSDDRSREYSISCITPKLPPANSFCKG